MIHEPYRYRFAPNINLAEVEDTLRLSVLSAEALHGEARVRLDAKYSINKRARRCEIDASTEVGQDLNRLFTRLLTCEFGSRAFSIEQPGPAAPLSNHKA